MNVSPTLEALSVCVCVGGGGGGAQIMLDRLSKALVSLFFVH